MYTINTILHPTDFSELSRSAFEMACSMAVQHNASLILLHVAGPPPDATPMPYNAVSSQTDDLDEMQLRRQLEELRTSKPTLTMEYVLERGEPQEVILQVAKEAACNAIVMGAHGRTGLNRLLMGSVAESVMRRAPCPVITVKEPILEGGAVASESVPVSQ